MAEMLLVNPRRRTRRKTGKRRTAAQRAATRRLVALNKRRRNPAKRRSASASRRRASPVRRRRSRRRRNPILGVSTTGVKRQVMEAGTGALGALALDVANGYLPIPANLKAGLVGTGVKALLAIGVGVLAGKSKLVSARTAAKMADGALTVVLHDELKKQVANFAPGIQLGEYMNYDGLGYYGSGYPAGVMVDDPDQLGAFPSLNSLQPDSFGMSEYMDTSYMQ